MAGCIEHFAPESQKSGKIFSLFIPCTDDLANKANLANNYSTPLLSKVPEANQVLDGRITSGFLVQHLMRAMRAIHRDRVPGYMD